MSRALRLILALLSCLPAVVASNDASWPVPAVAEGYVRVAYEQNLILRSQALDVDAARARLELANAARQPRLDFGGRYSRADGGRTIDVPAGDLLNPVYRTLNEMLAAQGRTTTFPLVSNLAIPLLREREQETRLRLTAPLFNSELARWSASRRSALEAATLQQAAFRRDLRFAVLQAYYDYLRARSVELILRGAMENTREAVRVGRALLAVDKVTEDRVLRAEADDLAVAQQLADAARDRGMAQHTFNRLLRRPLDAALQEPPADELAALTAALTTRSVPELRGYEAREELAALQAAAAEAGAAEAAVRARTRPTLALIVDGGIQGESYRIGSGANYAQGSLIAEFNLWDGRHRRSELEVARTQRRKADLQIDVMRDQLALEARTAADELTAARAAMPAAQRRTEAAARAFQLVAAREREGMTNQLAFLDARQAHTSALLNLEITRQRLFVAAARLDRALAASPID